MKRGNLLIGGGAGPTRRTLLTIRGPTRRQTLLQQAKIQPTRFQNHKGRDFYVTLKGTYVVLKNGKRVYGHKAKTMNGRPVANRSVFPTPIRPKRIRLGLKRVLRVLNNV